MRKFKLLIVSVIVVSFLALYGLSLSLRVNHADIISPRRGTADLAGIDPAHLQQLEGEWAFWENQLLVSGAVTDTDDADGDAPTPQWITVPERWIKDPAAGKASYGFGSYQVELTGLDPAMTYGISLETAATAYQIFINGEPVVACGTVGVDAKSHTPDWQESWGVFRADDRGRADLVIEVSNFSFYQGGLWVAPRIADYQTVSLAAARRLNLAVFLFASFMTMGFFFLVLSHVAKDNRSTLFIALLSLLSGVRVLFTGVRLIALMFPGIDWEWIARLDHLSGFLLLPALGSLVCSLNFTRRHPWIASSYALITLLSLVITLGFPSEIYGPALNWFKYIALAYAIYFFHILMIGIKHRKQGALWITLSFVLIIAAGVDELFISRQSGPLSFATYSMLAYFSMLVITRFAELRLENLSLMNEMNTDPLTGLHNRFYLEQLMHSSVFANRLDRPLQILFLDLDRFKPINDNHGHEIGDEILRICGRRLRAALKKSDLIIRYGGDEFVILLDCEPGHKLQEIIQRIRDVLSQPMLVRGHTLQIGVSIGNMPFDPRQDSLQNAIRESDLAMYINKKASRIQPDVSLEGSANS